MATNLPSCFSIEFLELLLKFLVNFTLLKYVKSQRGYGFLITKELIIGFQILDLRDHFSASLSSSSQLMAELFIILERPLDPLLVREGDRKINFIPLKHLFFTYDLRVPPVPF